MQKMFLQSQVKQLLANGSKKGTADHDPVPVVKLFVPWGAATWLLTELDPNDQDLAFGLCDLGQGCPELGDVYLPELRAIRGPGGLYIERDMHFEGKHPLSVYAEAARRAGHIVESISTEPRA